jgi:uncharacterized protein YjbJ (UPF0337 family)
MVSLGKLSRLGPDRHLQTLQEHRPPTFVLLTVVERFGGHSMDKDRVKGSATNLGGKMKEGAGKLSGDEKLRTEGVMDQIKGKVQNMFGGLKDMFRHK